MGFFSAVRCINMMCIYVVLQCICSSTSQGRWTEHCVFLKCCWCRSLFYGPVIYNRSSFLEAPRPDVWTDTNRLEPEFIAPTGRAGSMFGCLDPCLVWSGEIIYWEYRVSDDSQIMSSVWCVCLATASHYTTPPLTLTPLEDRDNLPEPRGGETLSRNH